MKTTNRILSFILIVAFLAACTPAPTALPTATATPAPAATQTQTPTITPTPEPSLTPTPATPEIDAWMEEVLNEVDYAVETVDGVFEVVTTLEDGQKIVMFEYVDGAWRPSYKSMGEFITEDGGFKLEDALKYLVIRKDGEYKLDQGDYDRFVEEVNGIWEAWCKELVASGNLGAYQDGQKLEIAHHSNQDYFRGYVMIMEVNEEAGEMLQVLGAMSVEGSEAKVAAVGGADGFMIFIVLPKTRLEYGYDWAPYKVLKSLAGEAVGEGKPDYALLEFALESAELNQNFGGEADKEIMTELAAWIAANPHDGKYLRSLFNHGPVLEALSSPGGTPVVMVAGRYRVDE